MHSSLRAIIALAIGIVLLMPHASTCAAEAPQEKMWECRWTTAPITIDGQAAEPAWANAQPIEPFTVPWLPGNPAGKSATRARLLWDADALYFLAEMDDGDLFADITEHDGQTWHNDVIELFIKPAADKKGYYELQVSAAGTTFDMFIPVGNDARGFAERVKRESFAWKSTVVRRGTLNERDDRDEGWLVEGRIPWIDLIHTGARPEPEETWRFALCRIDFDVRADKPEFTTNAPLTAPNFHQTDKYAPLKFIGPTAAELRPHGLTERVPLTTSTVIGSPDPPPPYRAVQAFPQLVLNNPIMVRREPGAKMLWALMQDRESGYSSLVRFRDDPEVTDVEWLYTFEGVAYDLTFHPHFADNGQVFVGWNGPLGDLQAPGYSRVSRFTVERAAPHLLDADSEVRIIEWASRGHDGGAVEFGHDGCLYVTSGDGTSDADENIVGQDLTRLTAKVLRLDVDGVTDADRNAGRQYAVPKDNPFVDLAGARPETWAYGLRNPWRMTVDANSGRLWVTQNGQALYEQVYLVHRGENYGWSVTEGSHPYYLERKRGPTPIIPPTAEHPHSEARSLTGGVVYHGSQYADLQGSLIYGDFTTGKIWALLHDGSRVVKHREIADTPLAITAFALDSAGELLICNYRRAEGEPAGGLYRLEPSPPVEGPSTFPRRLSESGLFAPGQGHTVMPGVVPYTVNSPLWSDGAYKERFFALPGDGTLTYTPRRSWGFPEGTVLIKSFALEAKAGDPQSRRWVETRFFTKQAGEWAGYSYEWNAEQTDATLVESAGRDRVFDIADEQSPGGRRAQSWHFPSRAECMICHSQAAKHVLGVSTGQLNCEQDYGGVRDNQLRALSHVGIVKGIEGAEWKEQYTQSALADGRSATEIDASWIALLRSFGPQRRLVAKSSFGVVAEHFERMADPYDGAAPLDARARSYLHTNCANCHVHGGGGNSKIQLSHWVALAETSMIDERPLHSTFGLVDPRILAPGKPESSVLLHRIAQAGRGRMPPIATSLVDDEAVALIREWIATWPPASPTTRVDSK